MKRRLCARYDVGMIVDMHTHLWQSPDQLGEQISAQLRQRFAGRMELLDASPAAHEAAMEPVDVAVVLGFRSRHLGAHLPNDYIAEHVRRHSDRLIGFAGVDPTEPGTADHPGALAEQGFAGVTISPAAQAFHPADSRALPLYEACAEHRLPVLVHQGTHNTRDSRMEFARPYLFDEVARANPELRIVFAHCGHPWTDETLTLIGKHRYAFADLSNIISRPWQLYNVLLQAHQLDVMDKLLFGSDFPYLSPEQAIETMYSLNRFVHGTGLPSIPREKVRAIVERDAPGLLGIRSPAGARASTPADSPNPRPTTTRSAPPPSAAARETSS